MQKPRIVAELLVFYGRCLENIDYITYTAYKNISHLEKRQSKVLRMTLYGVISKIVRSYRLKRIFVSKLLLQKGVLRGALFSVLCCLSHDLSLKISYTQPKESFTFLTSQGTLE